MFPHTYQVRDFAPALATRFRQVLISDVTGFKEGDQGGKPVFVRQLLQGKLNADYRQTGAGPCFVSVQAGTFRADAVEAGTANVESFAPTIEASADPEQAGRAVPGVGADGGPECGAGDRVGWPGDRRAGQHRD